MLSAYFSGDLHKLTSWPGFMCDYCKASTYAELSLLFIKHLQWTWLCTGITQLYLVPTKLLKHKMTSFAEEDAEFLSCLGSQVVVLKKNQD